MNKTFLECKQYGNTIVSRSNGKTQFFAILLDGLYYEFLIDSKGKVISSLQSVQIPEHLSNPVKGKYIGCCLDAQMN